MLLIGVLLGMPAAAEETGDDFSPPEGLHHGWYVRIETTKGRILARLLPNQAPQSVAHFAALADGRLEWVDVVTGETMSGHYYDGVPVYLSEAAARFETGDRTGTGRGAPLMYVAPEGEGPIDFHRAGRLGMTRSAGGRISAVQFFVTAAPQPWLTGRHPCFGEVIEGQEIVFNISQVKTYSNGKPIDPVIVEEIRIFKVGDPPALPEPVPYHPSPVRIAPRSGDATEPQVPPGRQNQ
jgi:cyclophilin family peptidyl-prolyl cis-trans isomerase